MNLLVFNIRTDADHPTQSVTTRWLNSFSSHYRHIYVITIHRGRLFLPDNVSVYPLKKREAGRMKMIVGFYALLLSLLTKKRIDAVFVHQAVLLGALAGPVLFLKKIPMVMWRSHKAKSFSLRVCHFFSKTVVSSSRDAFSFSSRKLIITGHGIDTGAFEPVKESSLAKNRPFMIGHAGRYSPVKKIEILLQAVAKLKNDGHAHFKVLLYGLIQNRDDERYFEYLKGLQKDLDIGERVEFHEAVNPWDMPRLLSRFDLLVSQQETGGTDKVILEAMSCGIPVLLATTTFNHLLDEKLREHLVFSSGKSSDMAQKMLRFMEMNDERRTSIGLSLRDLVLENHSLNRFSRRVKEILISLQRGEGQGVKA